MDFLVEKIMDNAYALTGEWGIFFVTLQTSPPILDNEGKLISEAYLFKEKENEWSCHVRAPFIFLISEYRNSNVNPKEYLLGLLQQEAKRVLDVDLTKPFNKVMSL